MSETSQQAFDTLCQVDMNAVGIISEENGKIYAFGAGPCLIVGIVNSYAGVALLGHVSTPEIATRLIQIIYFYEKALKDSRVGGLNIMYLVGGYEFSNVSMKTRDSILKVVTYFPDLEITVVDNSCRTSNGSQSLIVGTNGTVGEYKMTGEETMSETDALRAMQSAYDSSLTLLFRPGCKRPHTIMPPRTKALYVYSGYNARNQKMKSFNEYCSICPCCEKVKELIQVPSRMKGVRACIVCLPMYQSAEMKSFRTYRSKCPCCKKTKSLFQVPSRMKGVRACRICLPRYKRVKKTSENSRNVS